MHNTESFERIPIINNFLLLMADSNTIHFHIVKRSQV